MPIFKTDRGIIEENSQRLGLSNGSWAAAGTVTGMTLGVAANVLQRGSIYAKDVGACLCFAGHGLIAATNQMRDSDTAAVLNNPVYQAPLLLPSLGMACYNAYNWTGEGKPGVTGYLGRLWTEVSPLAYSSFRGLGTSVLSLGPYRILAQGVVGCGVVISGHAMRQGLMAMGTIRMLQHANKHATPWQQTALMAIAAGIAVTDVVWAYNTAANCHSAIEVAAAVAIVAASEATFTGGEVLVSKAYNAARTWWLGSTSTVKETASTPSIGSTVSDSSEH